MIELGPALPDSCALQGMLKAELAPSSPADQCPLQPCRPWHRPHGKPSHHDRPVPVSTIRRRARECTL